MQANCPSCGNKITIDDARVPDRPFSVKCPKCQNAIKLPGKGAAAAPAPAEPTPPPPTPPASPDAEEMRAQMMAQIRREMAPGEAAAGGAGHALVALPDRGLAGQLTLTLTRQGYAVDTLDDMDEGARLLEQGVYNLVATARVAGSQGKESLYQRINRLSPDARRRMFVLLVGDEFKTGDGTQAFASLADLVVHTRDAAAADAAFRTTMGERQRLYKVFVDARDRHEASAG